MRELLAPFDGSDNAIRAPRHAISLVKENGPLKLYIVTAHDEPEMYGYLQAYISREKLAGLQRENSESCLEVARQILDGHFSQCHASASS